MSVPNFEGNERKYVDDAIEQGWVSTGGAYITKLEQMMAEFLHAPEVSACQSGTSAIHLALIDCGVMPQDMVIVPTLTFIAAVNPVRYQFADPVFMDCDDSLCMDSAKLKAFCENECVFTDGRLYHKESGKHVKAIVVVHVFGNMADMEAIMDIAEMYNLVVIEDATEALGTQYTTGRYAGKYAGTIGHYGAYSFNGNKIITTGGGGAVTARDAKTVQHLRYLSTQAKDDPHYYVHNEIGYNYRMTNIQAALGVAQMEELPEFIRRKNRNYNMYAAIFESYELAELMPFRAGTESNRWFYSLKINRENIRATMRDIITAVEQEGVQTRAIWDLIHRQRPYEGSLVYSVETAETYSNCILNIPCSTQITEDEIDTASRAIKTVLERFANE